MGLSKHTRSQLEKALQVLGKKRAEVERFLRGQSLTDTIHNALQNELKDLETLAQYVEIQLEALHASCIFCRVRQPVEEPTFTIVCEECEERVFE